MTDDLVQFLRDRIDEDQQATYVVPPGPWRWVEVEDDGGERVDLIGSDGETVLGSQDTSGYHSWVWRRDGVDDYLAVVNPQRMLAEVDAKRRLVDSYATLQGPFYGREGEQIQGYHDGLEEAVKRLAAVYADHPEYRSEWAPDD